MIKRPILGALGLLALCTSVLAQVNTVPQIGIGTGYIEKATYSSAFFGLVPVVTSGTDQICITGSASKTVRVQRITIYGQTTTATQNVAINLVKRASADTGGTPASTTANPGVVTQINRRDPSVAGTATATLVSYTAAPTIVDTAPTYIDSQNMFSPLAASVVAAAPVDLYFGRDLENNLAPPTLNGVAQQVCVNNAATLTNTNLWNGSITWTEE